MDRSIRSASSGVPENQQIPGPISEDRRGDYRRDRPLLELLDE